MNTQHATLPAQAPLTDTNTAPHPKSSSGNWKRYLLAAVIGAVSLVLLLVAAVVGLAVIGYFVGSDPDRRDTFVTIGFTPEDRPCLKIGSAVGIAQSDWPKMIGSLVHTGAGGAENFSSHSLGSAQYEDTQRQWTLQVSLLPHSGVDDFNAQINAMMAAQIGDAGHDMSLTSDGVNFGIPEAPSQRMIYHPLQCSFLAISAHKVGTSKWDNEALEEVVETIAASITRPGTVPVGFTSYDDKKGERPYLRGPRTASAERWPSLNPTDDHFALTRTGLPMPQSFAHLHGDGASYSALNFEADTSRPVQAYFVPRAVGATEEDTFQSVIKSLADHNDRVPRINYETFTLTKAETDITWGAAHYIVTNDDVLCAVAACDTGVIIARSDIPVIEDSPQALSETKKLAYQLITQLVIKWNDA